MAIPRSSQISTDNTCYYHCYSRCVRRAFLCGEDYQTGVNYNHRKKWLVNRLAKLGSIFTIDICSYAVMSNHYHLVLHINLKKAKSLSNEEIIERWHQIYKGNLVTRRYISGKNISKYEMALVNKYAKIWRKRLNDISWFMRCLNEHIARKANFEDKCTGRFWEGRYKCQALLDESALLSCMVYVDLNPIRAGAAKILAESEHTSIKQRVAEHLSKKKSANNKLVPLMPMMVDYKVPDHKEILPLLLASYIELVDWTSRAITCKKKYAVDKNAPAILGRIEYNVRHYMDAAEHFEERFSRFAGKLDTLKRFCSKHRLPWVHGVGKKLYPS